MAPNTSKIIDDYLVKFDNVCESFSEEVEERVLGAFRRLAHLVNDNGYRARELGRSGQGDVQMAVVSLADGAQTRSRGRASNRQ